MLWINKNRFLNRYLPMALTVIVLAVAFLTYDIIRQQTQPVQAGWYGASWGYRKPITINHTKVSTASSTNLSNFPVLVSQTDTDLKNYASSTGADILFTSADGVTKLNHEIESYSSSTGALVAWVNVPSLSPSVNTVIYIYFGNPNAASQANPTGVWDSNYAAVYHMNQTLTGASQLVYDSTSNAVNATSFGSWTSGRQVAGQIGGSLSFPGSTSYYLKASSTSLSITNVTVQAWVKSTSALQQTILIDPAVPPKSYPWPYELDITGAGLPDFTIATSTLSGTYTDTGTNSIIDGNWHYVVGTYDGTTMRLYVDGVLNKTNTNYTGNLPTGGILYFGVNSSALVLNGQEDEARVSSIARTPDWISTEYANQSSPSTFYTYGTLVTQATSGNPHVGVTTRGWFSTATAGAWQYRMPLTINHTQVASSSATNLNNFPVLVSVTSNNLKYTGSGGNVASSTGGDLVFTDSDGATKLPYEIESYASTTGALIAWVQVPYLSALADHTIYVYYGNTSVTASLANPGGVWDSNYKGVWHLPNGTNLMANDSTVNGNNLTISGATATTGQIDGGAYFGNSTNSLKLPSQMDLGTNATYSFWLKTPPITTSSDLMGAVPSDISLYTGMTHKLFCSIDWSGWDGALSTVSVDDNMQHYIACTVSKVSGTANISLYVDGVLNATSTETTTYDPYFQTFGANGAWWNSISTSTIDEGRISSIARSADWIKTEYNNQSAPGTFVTAGGQQGRDTAVATSGWYNTAYKYRKAITVDHRKVSTASGTTLTAFPMLFSVTDADLRYTGSGGKVASSTAGDLLFTDSDGLTKLPYEIESYSSTTGAVVAWIQIPQLSPSADHTIYVYFGNASATYQANPTGVWDTNYKGVYHLPNGSTLSTNDSTSNTNTGTNTGGTATTGKIDGALSLTGSGTYVMTPSINLGTNFTVEQWVYDKSSSPSYDMASQNAFVSGYSLGTGSGSGWMFIVDNNQFGGGTYAQNTWTHLVGVYTGGIAYLYVNGALVTSGSGSAPTLGSFPIGIGGTQNGGTPWTGYIDETRFSTTARSADWIATEYKNQNSPSTFYVYSAVGVNGRQSSAGVSVPAMRVHGNVKFH